MQLSLLWIFIKLSFWGEDTLQIDDFLHREVVVKRQLMREEDFNKIHSIGKVSLVSYKMTYAYTIGKMLGNSLYGIILTILTLIPNLLLYFGMLVWLLNKADTTTLLYVTSGMAPVLAAYFLYNALTLLKSGYSHFPLFPFILVCLLGFLFVFVLQWPVALTLSISLFLFLCFMKGGSIHG